MSRVDVKQHPAKPNPGERGSALLIVFVFAAMIAIMLYMELPVAAFEAQRQKEQLLIDRGNEYAHAVKLFVRKIGSYPASMDALEKTNQMRFLRHRFKDPFTGKEDWRVLHAGPNGMLIDSKVKQTGTGQNGTGLNAGNQNSMSGNSPFGSSNTTNTASTSPFGNTSNTASTSPFGSSSTTSSSGSFGTNSSSSDSSTPAVVVPPVPQRTPAVSANGGGAPVSASGDQNPLAPLLPPTEPNGQPATPGQAATALPSGNTGTGSAAGSQTVTGNASTGTGTANNMGTAMGTINSGGIAGVASIAKGHTIKTVNDQTDYSLWEFYYDPTKDAAKGITNALGAMGAAQQANQQQNGVTPFGSSNNNNSSPFGSSTSTSTSPTPTTNNSASPATTSPQPTNPQ